MIFLILLKYVIIIILEILFIHFYKLIIKIIIKDSLEKLNSEPSINETKSSSTAANIGPMKYSRIPFNQADNPVLSVVTFLAAIADPKATKAAVKAAVEELENPNSLKKYIQNYKESILKKDDLLIKKDEEEKIQDDEKLAESSMY